MKTGIKKVSCFIDTNIFLRIIAKDDGKKLADCEQLVRLVIDKKLRAFTSSLVIAEVVWTSLSFYKLQKAEVVELVRGIQGIKNLKIQDSVNIPQAIDYYGQNNVKFIDCLIASHKHLTSGIAVVVSYDKDFDRLPVIRKEPSELLGK